MISDTINEVKTNFGEISVVKGNNHTFFGINIEIKDIMTQVDMAKSWRSA